MVIFSFFHRGTIRHIWDSSVKEIDPSSSPDRKMANSYRWGNYRHRGECPPRFPLAVIVRQGGTVSQGPEEVTDRLPNFHESLSLSVVGLAVLNWVLGLTHHVGVRVAVVNAQPY